jgi:antiviral helicase SKI2
MGAVWENAYAAMGQYNKLVADRMTVERQLAELRAIRTDPAVLLGTRLEYLMDRGFLTGTVEAPTLTPKGQMATEVNEGHPLVLVEAYERGVFAGLAGDEIVSVLGCFMAERQAVEGEEMTFADLTVADAVRRACEGVRGVADELWTAERASSGADYWAVGAQWVEVSARWLAEEPAAHICADFGLYEGNLIRGILKLSNLVEEFVSLATFKGDVGVLAALDGVSARLVRDVAVPDSLYLRL